MLLAIKILLGTLVGLTFACLVLWLLVQWAKRRDDEIDDKQIAGWFRRRR
ncbi:hypothetical protein [Actinomadura macra]|nr:hypothetical protein [Actinomadura macra]